MSCPFPGSWSLKDPAAVTDTDRISYCTSGSSGKRDITQCSGASWTTRPQIPADGLVGVCFGQSGGSDVNSCNIASGGGEGFEVKSVLFASGNGGGGGTTPAPTLSLTANPGTVTSGQASTLSWSSANATNCTASGAWSGSKSLSGSQSTGALTAAASYTLACTGAGGTATQTVNVSISSGSGGSTPSFTRRVIDPSSPNDPWMKNIADLNNDNLPDLIVSGATGPIVWYQAPDWTKHTISQSANSESGSAVGDINGDGLVDVVVGKTWYQNVGGGASWTAHTLPSASNVGTHDIVVADVNGDGKQDIVMRGEDNATVGVFLQQTPTSWQVFTLDPGTGRNGLDVADVDGDGRLDIVVGGVWMQNPGSTLATANWQMYGFAPNWNQYASAKVADMDGDGHPDIVLSVSEDVGKLSWFKAPANPHVANWAENVVAQSLTKVHAFVITDFNRDGRPDIAASEYAGAGRLILYLQNGSGGWQSTQLGTDALHNMRGGDIGNDGDIDLFGVTAFGTHPIILYENQSSAAADKRVLVFSKTLGFRHDSIPDGIAAIKRLGTQNGFAVDATEDSTQFTAANLARYQSVVFLNPSGDVLSTAQRTAFQQYIENGGGFVGVHNAAALTLEDWDWYTQLVGGRYQTEIETQPMRLRILDSTHASTQGLPDPWSYTEEAYNWAQNPKVYGVNVLINLDESSVQGGTMGADHPFAWYRSFDGGRSWYTTGGSNSPEWSDANFLRHVLGGIKYASGY